MKKSDLAVHIATRERSLAGFGFAGAFLPNPDPILKRMGRDVAVYRDLLSDAHIGGCVRRRKAAVRSLSRRVEQGKASGRITRLCEDVLASLDMDRLISEIMDAPLFGWQPLEVLYKSARGSAPQVMDVVGKPVEWFCFDADARLRFREMGNLQGVLLPERKFLLARQDASYANPYGFADLSMCFWPGRFKHGGVKFWFKFAEKYGMPWVVGKQPRNTPEPETNRLLDQLEDMIEDAVAAIPDDASIEIMQAGNTSGNADAYEKLLMHCRSEIAVALLGQNQSTEASATHASATAGNEVASTLRDADAGIVRGTINTLFRWITDLNEGETAPAPTLEIWEESEVSKTQAERDEILARAGVRFTPAYWKRTYDLLPGDIDEAPVPRTEFSEAPPPVLGDPLPSDPRSVPEAVTDRLTIAAQGAVDVWLQQIEAIVTSAPDFSTLQKNLLTAFGELDDADLVEVMAAGFSAARAAGMADALPKKRG